MKHEREEPLTYEDLTPTEQLILEVLAARWRVGDDDAWTFQKNVARSIRFLAEKKLVWAKNGVFSSTMLVGLTTAGKDMVLSPTYTGKGRPYELSATV